MGPGARAVLGLTVLAGLGGAALVGRFVFLTVTARRPETLGPKDGRLAPCPGTMNCVSSLAPDGPQRVAPIAFAGPPEVAMARMREAVSGLPRTVVVTRTPVYLHAEATSRLFRFVDDLELLLDPRACRFEVRSASRSGRAGLGGNRARVEELRARFGPAAAPPGDRQP